MPVREENRKLTLGWFVVLIEFTVMAILALLTWGPQHESLAAYLPRLETFFAATSTQPAETVSTSRGEIKQSPAIPLPEEKKEPAVTINLVGDILLADRVGEVIKNQGPDYPWEQLRDILAAADITVGNLECAVGSGNHRPMSGKQFTFLANPQALAGAKNAGVTVLTLANNHILDYGPEALLETIRHLDEHGIRHTGAGVDITTATKPVIVDVADMQVGVLAFAYVFPSGDWVAGRGKPGLGSGYDYNRVYESVSTLSEQTDLTIVSLHWGRELADKPSPDQQKLARQLVDLGADIVLGHHPHVLQGLERYKHGLIAYSTGNFIFTLSTDTRGRQSMVLQVKAGSDGITAARVVPAWIEYGRTVPGDGQNGTAVVKRMQRLSRELGTKIDSDGVIVLDN